MNNQEIEQNTFMEISAITSKKARNKLIQRKFEELLASLGLCRQGVDSSKRSKIKQETKLSKFQYEIIHNILLPGVLLHKMKIVNSPLCIYIVTL